MAQSELIYEAFDPNRLESQQNTSETSLLAQTTQLYESAYNKVVPAKLTDSVNWMNSSVHKMSMSMDKKRKESSGMERFMGNLGFFLTKLIKFILILVFVLLIIFFVMIEFIISLAFIIIGAQHLYESCDKNLPVWLLVSGITQMIGLIFGRATENDQQNKTETRPRSARIWVFNIFLWFKIAWFITGAVWVFQMDPINYVCNATVYFTVYWYIKITLCVLASIIGFGLLILALGLSMIWEE
jgi:hypothetical protein